MKNIENTANRISGRSEIQMKILLTSSLISIFILYTSYARSEAYQYFNNSPLHLGGTFDPREMTTSHLPCIVFDGRVQLNAYDDEHPLGSPIFNIDEIKSHRDLYNFLHVSASMSGHYKFFSGSGSYDLERESSSDEDSYSWIIHGYTQYGEFGMSNPRLTPEAAKLVGNPDAFRARCGTDYVGQETRSVIVAAIFTVKNFQESKREKIEASIKLAVEAGVGGGEGEVKYKSLYNEAISSGTLSFKLFAIGGKGISVLYEIPLKTDDIKEIKIILSNYIKSLSVENSVPTEFLTNSLSVFYPELASFDFGQYNKFIQDAYYQQLEYEKKREKLLSIMNNKEDYELTEEAENNLVKNYDLLTDYIQKISKRAGECRKLHSGKLSKLTSDSAKIDKIGEVCFLDSSLIIKDKFTLPKPSPFTFKYWTDELSNAPQIFMYVDIKGTHLSEVKILSANNAVLKVLKIDDSKLPKSALGAIEYSAVTDQDKPLKLQVTMESGTAYTRDLTYDSFAPVSAKVKADANKVQILEKTQLLNIIPFK